MIYRPFIGLGLVFFLIACSGPAYYTQAISGQWKLMHARQDIQLLLDDPGTNGELTSNLQTAGQILTFANSTLHLPSNGSYSDYVEIDGDALLWNVVATEEFSLQPKKWCFLFAGCVPYRGFFKQQKAEDSAENLRRKDMDVLVSPVAAFSSLGWFKDPLLSTMFSGSDARLAAYLFHELAHQRLYLRDDGQFNESYASFVEEAGVKAWLLSNQRESELQEWQQYETVGKDFSELVSGLYSELGELYQSDKADGHKRQVKTDAFQSFELDYEQLVTDNWQGKHYYASWFREPLNNARLALFNTYKGSHCAFKGLLAKADGDLGEFHHLAEQISRLEKHERQEWMKQPCASIAPEDNL